MGALKLMLFYNNKVILIHNKIDTWKTTGIIYKIGPIAVYSFMNPQIEKYVDDHLPGFVFLICFVCAGW